MEINALTSEKDTKIITDVVNTFWGEGYACIKLQLLRIFAHDITCNHYITMGQVIGQRVATANKSNQKIKFYASNN